MFNVRSTVLSASIINRLVPTLHKDGGEAGEDSSQWRSFWLQADLMEYPESRIPVLFKVERPLKLTDHQPVSLGISYHKGREAQRQNKIGDLIYIKVRSRGEEHKDWTDQELSWVEWGPIQDGVWVPNPEVEHWYVYGEGCRGVLFLNPIGQQPQVTTFQEQLKTLWEGSAWIRYPNPLPEGVRRFLYNGVAYTFGGDGNDCPVKIYDRRRHPEVKCAKVQHICRKVPNLCGKGFLLEEYFIVMDDPTIESDSVCHVLMQKGLIDT